MMPAGVAGLKPRQRLLAIASFAADNGTERMVSATLQGVADSVEIHLLPAMMNGRFFAELRPSVTIAGRLCGHRKRGAFWINRLLILWHLLMLRPQILMVFNYQWGIAAGAACQWLPGFLRPQRTVLVHHLLVAVSGSGDEQQRILRYLPCFARHIVPSHSLSTELLETVPSVAPKSVLTIHNGLDIQNVRALAEQEVPALSTGGYRWLSVYVGGMRPDKRVDRLLRCFSCLPEREQTLLVLIGDGACRSELERMAGELGIMERCLFLGHQANPYPYIQQADILVQASDCETFGLTLLEAMMLKTPVLAMRGFSAGLLDVIQDGVNGRLVEGGDEAAFVEAWSGLLQHPEYRDELVIRADTDSSKFSLAAMVEGYREALGLS